MPRLGYFLAQKTVPCPNRLAGTYSNRQTKKDPAETGSFLSSTDIKRKCLICDPSLESEGHFSTTVQWLFNAIGSRFSWLGFTEGFTSHQVAWDATGDHGFTNDRDATL
jgi:hypothetical protein